MQVNRKEYSIDWMFLLFLAGVTYVKLYVKITVAILYLLYCIWKRFKFTLPKSLHVFYVLMPVTGLIGAWLHGSFLDDNYPMAYLFGTVNWLTAGGVSYLLYVAVMNLSRQVLHTTIKAFFLINALVSLGELAKMMIDSGSLIPYWYWGAEMYYGGATGDHIFGLTGNISVTNAAITAMGCLYFIFTKEIRWALLCLMISMLCTSNLTLIVLLGIIILVILFVKDRKVQKYAMYSCIVAAIVYPVLTYDNVAYINTIYSEDIKYKDYSADELAIIQKNTKIQWKEEPLFEITAQTFKRQNKNYYKTTLSDSFYTTSKSDFKYIKISQTLKADELHSVIPPNKIEEIIEKWYDTKHGQMSLATYHYPIKLYTYQQTLDYLLSGHKNLIAGAGTGNFSSKQAIKTTGLGLQGSYPIKNLYINKAFIEYHLYSLLYVLALPVAEHSIINMPNSIYNQVAGEYGVIGIILFLILYIGFFWERRKLLRVGIYITLFTLMMLGFDYWFEMISLTVIFELFMFMDIYKEDAAEQ